MKCLEKRSVEAFKGAVQGDRDPTDALVAKYNQAEGRGPRRRPFDARAKTPTRRTTMTMASRCDRRSLSWTRRSSTCAPRSAQKIVAF